MKFYGKVKVKKVEFMTEDAFKMVVDRPNDMVIEPGQFFMIKNVELHPLLNRPISVSSYNETEIEFGIKIVGTGTENFSKLRVDDEIFLMGALGNGFDLKKEYKKVLLVGGGIGVEPLKGAAMELNKMGIFTKMFLGFNNECFDIDIFKKIANEVITFSEAENKADFIGYPTDILNDELSKSDYDAVFTCGPKILMKKVNEISKANNVETQLLLEERMACGIGACLGCTCETVNGYKKVCEDGPMFYGNEVNLNE
ncbi:dihydroorotate dehydrogenase electron transfer subunit [Clostridiaceae bacterium HSG29]|nr:dihydroorotate dehydrogenase electron transfer subunit [Clostridiaceae bacterium HSG29]